jgi:hypothetical protein
VSTDGGTSWSSATGGIYSGTGTSTLILTGITTFHHNNQYRVQVGGGCGSGVTSTARTLTVNENPEIAVGGHPSASTICENTGTSFSVNAGVTTVPTYQWQVSTDGGVSYMNVADDANHNNVTASTLDLINTPLSFHARLYRVVISGTCSPSVTSNAALLTVNQNPMITGQPVNVTSCEGSTVSYSVTATGAALTYAWEVSTDNGTSWSSATGGIYSNEGTSTLTLTGITTSHHNNQYRVQVGGGCGSGVTSIARTLTVNENPEVAVGGHPSASTICENTGTSFSVNAGVTTLPTYQWQMSTDGGVSYSVVADDAEHNTVTSATLNLVSTPLSFHARRYRVVISGTCSPSVTSSAGLLTVNQNTTITGQPVNVASCEGSTVSYSVTATGAALTYAWEVSTNGGTSWSSATGGIYSNEGTSTLTLTGIATSHHNNQYRVQVGSSCGPGVTSIVRTLTVNENPEIAVGGNPSGSTICENTGTSFSVNAGATTLPTYQWEVSTDGGVSYSNVVDDANHDNVTSSTLNLISTPLGFNARRYRVVISGTCSPSVTSSAGLLTVNQNTMITGQPVNVTSCEGSTIIYSVTATGMALTYAWEVSTDNGASWSSATGGIYSNEGTSTLTLTGIATSHHNSQYRVQVGSGCGGIVTSIVRTLTVNENPEIAVGGNPSASTICENTGTSFSVNAGVTTLPTYQWEVSTDGGVSYSNVVDDANHNNVTASTLDLINTPLGFNTRRYRVIISGTCSPSVTSSAGLLTVNQNPAITGQPVNVISCEGSTVSYSVTVTGMALTYAWEVSTDGGTSWSSATGGIYSGTGTSTLILTGITTFHHNNQYRVQVGGGCGSGVTSTVRTLTVNENPEIAVGGHPSASTICENTGTSFSVNAGVTTLPTYQWQVSTDGGLSYSVVADDAEHNTVTSATLNLVSTPLSFHARRYRVVISGTCSPSVTSNAALLTVNQNPMITGQPVNVTSCEGSTVIYSVTATGAALTYAWEVSTDNGTSWSSATGGIYSNEGTSTLTLTGITTSHHNNQYRVQVGGGCGSGVTSIARTLTVNENPEVAVGGHPSASTICENTGTSFSVNAGATTLPTYQWQMSTDGGVSYSVVADDAEHNTVTSATLNLVSTPLSFHARRYRVVISGTCSPSVTSSAGLLTVNQNTTITGQPVNVASCEGSTVSYSVTATGAALTYAWEVSTNGGTSWSSATGGIYSNEGTSTLTLTGIATSHHNNQYRVQVGSSCGPGVTSIVRTLTVNENPEISVGGNPSGSTICENTGTSFSVNAGATTLPTYQWEVSTDGGVSYSNVVDDANHDNVTSSTLNLISTPLGFNARRYRVVISGTCSPSVTSSAGLLTVNQNTMITGQPVNVISCEGSTIIYSVTATGMALTYAWEVSTDNGASWSSATGGIYSNEGTSTLTLTGIATSHHNSQYRVQVGSGCGGIVTSIVRTLTVNENPEIAVGGHPSASTICENTGTSFSVNAGVTTLPTYQWEVSTDGGVSYSNVVDDANHNNVTASTLDLINTPLGFNTRRYRVIISGTCSPSVTSSAGLLTVNQNPAITGQPVNVISCEGSTVSYSVTVTGMALTYAWEVSTDGGTSWSSATGGIYSGTGTSTLILTGITTFHHNNQYRVQVGGGCGSGVTSTVRTLTVNENPEIAVGGHPSASTICENTGTSFSVNAGVTTVPTYQWQVSTDGGLSYSVVADDAEHNTVTSATLNLVSTPLSFHARRYRVVISGTCSPSVTSNAALLTVNQNPMITGQPVNVTSCEGSMVIYSVTATGAALTYAWEVSTDNGTSWSSATGGIYSNEGTSTLTLTGITTSHHNNQYRVQVGGGCGSGVTSIARTLTVNENPEVAVGGHPSASTICENTGTSFSVNAGATTLPTYQWQMSTDGGVSYSVVADDAEHNTVTSATLNLVSTPLSFHARRYRVVISGTCSPSVTSSAGLLTVNQNTTITGQPVNVASCEGSTVSYSVTATGAALTYAWEVSTNGGTSWSSATGGIYSNEGTSTLTLTGIATSHHNNQYRVQVGSSCGPGVTSIVRTLTVNENPEISVGGNPSGSTICENTGTSFSVNAGATTLPTYQWEVSTDGGVSYSNVVDDANHDNVTSSTLNLISTPLGFNARRYRVVISGTCSPSVTSSAGLLTVNQNTMITGQPVNVISCEGSTIIYSVTATGMALTYAWEVSTDNGASWSSATGGIYSNEGTSTLTLTGIATSHHNSQYRVQVGSGCGGIVTSIVRTLTVNENPEIAVGGHPSASTICENTGTSFSVNAGVTTLPTYQWEVSTDGGVSYSNVVDDANHNNVTASTLDLINTPLGFNTRRYRVIISGTCSPSVTSSAGLLTVNQNPAITGQPVNVISCEGSTVSYSVTVTGMALTYAWEVSTDGGTSWSSATGGIYSGTGTSTLILTGITTFHHNNQYRVQVGGGCGSGVTSMVRTLTVNENPEIAVGGHPSASTICENTGTSFSVNAGVTTLPTYQWQMSTDGGLSYSVVADDAEHNTVTSATLNLVSTPLSFHARRYRVVISGTCSPSVTSNAALLTVNQNPMITGQPVNVTSCEGSTVIYSVTATGAALTYAWEVSTDNGTSWSSATGASTATKAPRH